MMLKTIAQPCYIAIKINILILILAYSATNLLSQDLVLRFNHLTVKNGLSQNRVHGIVKDKYGFMWFASWEGLSKYDGYKFINYNGNNNNSKILKNTRINRMYKDANGDIWAFTFDTLILRYNYEKDNFTKFTRYTAPKNVVDSLIGDKVIFFTFLKNNKYTWRVYQLDNILTKTLPLNKINNLLTQINNKSGQEYIYRQNQLNPSALNDEYVFCIYIDDNEKFWVGTYGGGVNVADLRQKQFRLYQHSALDKNTIIDNAIRAICEDNHGNLWIGTNNKGISKFNRKQNKFTHFQFNPHDTLNSLINNLVRMIFCDRYGYIWIGTKGGLDRFDPKNNRFRHYTYTSGRKIPDNSVFWIFEDHFGYLWIATFNGIAKYDRQNDRFLAYKTDYFPKQNRVRVIIDDRKNNLWIATDGGGLLCLHRNTSAGLEEKLSFVAHYQNSPQNSNSLSDNRIYAMLEDEKGFIWLGTGAGLDRFDPQTKTFTHFNKKNGLPDEWILGILKDDKGNIWISHKKGLSKINSETFKTRNYASQDGLQDAEFSEDAYFRNDLTGELFFGGFNGLNSFYPDSIKDNTYLPKIVFTNLEISNTSVPLNKPFNGRIILNKPLYLTKSITLTHMDKSVSIEFAALHYSNPNNNKYAYKLEGFDQNWINTDASRRIATYSNLDPRTYIFKVRASNSDGLWNPIPAELKIIVLPPWWKTLAFRILFILTCLLLIFMFSYWRIASYRRKEIELNFLIQLRTEELEKKNIELRREQARIQEQSEELFSHSENLMHANKLLTQKQKLIQLQSDKLEETNRQLSVLNSTKDRFFSIIAHDLRNPFHAVIGFSELLLVDIEKYTTDKIRKYLGLIHSSSQKGNDLLENLLQWSRAETGRISYEPVNLNLYAIVENTIILLEALALRKNIQITQEIEPAIMVHADENMLNTIFRNLISNAIKFTRENGTIIIMARVVHLNVEISVIDNGVGISEENLKLLFHIESNISTKGTSHESGTGLGLILCREFVEKHGGKIWVESKKGQGSKFKFTLPMA